MSGKIRVSTEKIREKGSEWEETAKQAERNLQNIKEVIGQMDACFHCEAVSYLQSAFYKLAQDGENKIKELCSHVKKLQDIAKNYEEAEKENEHVTADY